ncbi:MAG: prenyltransferase/squalene oxidase repeat-containing protein [Gaiellaceae bacterium]
MARLRISLFLVLAATLLLAGTCSGATSLGRGASYLLARQQSDGGFAEPGASSSAGLTAWAVLGLAAVGRAPAQAQAVADYLERAPVPQATDLELRLLAEAALGRNTSQLADALERLRQPGGRIGPAFNSTYWGTIALRAAGRIPGNTTVRYILRVQHKNGGWSWSLHAAPDAGDTAAAIQALRAGGASARSTPIKRGVRFLRRCQNKDGGFGVAPGSISDAQSTAWAIQALLAARTEPGKAAFLYLKKLQRRDGSFRYNARYVTTPTWVTAQVLCALARKPFPF